MPERRLTWLRHRYPEVLLALTAAAVFLGYLGALELWGKREQRAVAESIDTVDNGHWLVAEIQGRPRLEKPPLPRWTTAMLMMASGQRDEWIMRLPAALSALAMVGLVYGLGRRIAGRHVGLASGFALTSIVFFVVEMRQAGNDGPLAAFVTLAVYCAWRRLHGAPLTQPPGPPAEQLGNSRWSIGMYAALGCAFLCKGPVALLLAALAILPYLAIARRFKAGCRALMNGWGVAILVGLILAWPVPVLLSDRRALDVWLLEMGQKAGTAGITHHRWRGPLAMEWFAMTAPWTVLATLALVVPVVRRGRGIHPGVWLVWFWAVGNLAMFSLWSVAKPNYYLPCMPAVALLGGFGWSWLASAARRAGRASSHANRVIRGHWIAFAVLALAAPFFVARNWPQYTVWTAAGGALLLAGVAASIWCWLRHRATDSLIALVVAASIAMVVGYGAVGPRFNNLNGHHELARQIERLVPNDKSAVLFYSELDEGLWYYLHNHRLRPVLQPRYNKSLDLLDDFKEKRIIWNKHERFRSEGIELARWIEENCKTEDYMLIKAKMYDILAPQLEGLAQPLYREADLERNELVLLRVQAPARAAVAENPASTEAAATRLR